MNRNQCDYCLYLAYDIEEDEHYCSVTLDQDDIEKLRYNKYDSCPFYRMGDDYIKR